MQSGRGNPIPQLPRHRREAGRRARRGASRFFRRRRAVLLPWKQVQHSTGIWHELGRVVRKLSHARAQFMTERRVSLANAPQTRYNEAKPDII